MHIAHHETRDLLHVLDKRQQDMSATLQTALSSSGDSGRTEVAPRASRQQGKSKLKKRRGKLEKISQAMTDPQWSYFKVSRFCFLELCLTFFLLGLHTKASEAASESQPFGRKFIEVCTVDS